MQLRKGDGQAAGERGTAGGLVSAQSQQNGTADVDASKIAGNVDRLRATFKTDKTKDLKWREQQLKQLRKMMAENIDEWTEAVCKDLGRSKAMAVFGDMTGVIASCDYCLDNLAKWTAPRKKSLKLELQPGSAFQRPEPKGVVLNIAPWNFPVELIVTPMAYMIAAGNCVVVKPSEISAHCAALFAKLVPQYLDPEAFLCISGGVAETTALLECRFDHILYTGNNSVAKIVMAAAAKHLTPVTLELGGKSPVIIDANCNLHQAVKRVLNIKTLNCGQICLAPDYVLLHKDQEAAFYSEVKAVLSSFYPEGQHKSPSYDRIINKNHWNRLKGMLESDHGGEIVVGGLEHANEEQKLFPTTIVKNPALNSRLLREEIFGSILPVVTVQSIDEAVDIIKGLDHPLGMYIFSKNQSTVDNILNRTTSGGVTVNDCLMHILEEELPFGGIGSSGMGSVHGQAGFDQVSHLRSVLHRGNTGIDLLGSIRYPPHDDAKHKQLRMMALHAHTIKGYAGVVFKCLGAAALFCCGIKFFG